MRFVQLRFCTNWHSFNLNIPLNKHCLRYNIGIEMKKQKIIIRRLDLNAAESGVQHNPSQPGRTNLQGVCEQQGGKDSCPC